MNDDAFPPEFDAAYYRDAHSDLEAFTDAQLIKHYEEFGRREGRAGCAAAFRAGLISAIPPFSRALEIGPGSAPVLSGSGVEYFDVLDRAALLMRAQKYELDAASTPERIHYVSETGDMGIVPSGFDVVFSSHAIEHQPCLVRHLQEVARVLRPGGVYVLAIPDKRYCFDALAGESDLASVLAAYFEQRKTHTLENLLRIHATLTHNDPSRHWAGDHGQSEHLAERIKETLQLREAGTAYQDAHAWRVTPTSFRRIMEDLTAIGHSPLAPLRVYQTPCGQLEFCAVLWRPS